MRRLEKVAEKGTGGRGERRGGLRRLRQEETGGSGRKVRRVEKIEERGG